MYKYPADLTKRLSAKREYKHKVKTQDYREFTWRHWDDIYFPCEILFIEEVQNLTAGNFFIKEGEEALLRFFESENNLPVGTYLILDEGFRKIVPAHWKDNVRHFRISDERGEGEKLENFPIGDRGPFIAHTKSLHEYRLEKNYDRGKIGFSSLFFTGLYKLGHFSDLSSEDKEITNFRLTLYHHVHIIH